LNTELKNHIGAGLAPSDWPRICMLSVHTCPLAALGGKETGGMNVYVRELSRQLGQLGFGVDIFTRSQNPHVPHIDDTDLGPNVRVIHVVSGQECPATRHETWLHLPEFVEHVLSFMQAERINYDLYHSHYWLSGWVARHLQALHPAPLIQMFHTLGRMKNLVAASSDQVDLGPRVEVETELMRVADRLVAATPRDGLHMHRLYGADIDRIAVIPPGVDLSLFRPIPQAEALTSLRMSPNHGMILFVGRLDPIKGLETLVRAIAIVVEVDPALRGDMCLCIVGGDASDDMKRASAEMQRIDALRVELGLEDVVTWLGPQGQAELPHYYSAAQMVVMPSHYETFGMVALEAMACGTPVVASNVGGLSFIVEHGKTGLLVPYKNPRLLAEALLALLERPELRRQMGRNGTLVARRYGWPRIARRVLDLYAELAREFDSLRVSRAPGVPLMRL
jgi:D-inositol-3-phosphate glycosyltransferase